MRYTLYTLLSSVAVLFCSVSGFAQPVFTAGHTQTITVCQNSAATATNTQLRVTDPSTGNTDTWSLNLAAAHGTAVVAYTTTSAGTTLTPTGTSYTPAAGYLGNDSFKVNVTNGATTDLTTIYVKVVTTPGPITGPSTVCQGYIITLSDGSAGGTWSSSNTAVANVSVAGLASGVSGGTATITYRFGSGCQSTAPLTVYPTSPITGTPEMCPGASVILADAISGGTWSSSNTAIATVTGGTVTGVSAGTATITYTYSTGCISFVTATVDPTPSPISGLPRVCIGSVATLADADTGGIWTSTNTSTAVIDSFTGIVSGIAVGPATISYTFTATGCAISVPFTVNPLPNQYAITGGGNYCSADTGVHIYLSSYDPANSYFLHTGSTTFGPFFGSGAMVDFGLRRTPGSYTAFATTTSTGCSNVMTGTATVSVTPSVPVSLSISSSVGDTICSGTIDVFSAVTTNAGTAPVYKWQVNGADVGTSTATYTFGPANGDVVSVSLLADTACALPDSQYISYTAYVIPPVVPSITLGATPDTIICMGSSVIITPTPTYGGKAPKYYYEKGGAPVGAGSTLAYVPSDGDVFDAFLVSNYFCRSKDTVKTSILIHVDTPVIPSFNIDAYPAILTAPGQTVMFTALVTNYSGPLSYQWYINDSLIKGATTDTFITSYLTYMGNDSISCDVTRYGACYLGTFNWRMMENNVGVHAISASFADLNVLPNPANGNFTIKGSVGTGADVPVTIEVTNMLGQAMYSKKITAAQGSINEQVLMHGTVPDGMYLLSIRSATEKKVFHLVIQQ